MAAFWWEDKEEDDEEDYEENPNVGARKVYLEEKGINAKTLRRKTQRFLSIIVFGYAKPSAARIILVPSEKSTTPFPSMSASCCCSSAKFRLAFRSG